MTDEITDADSPPNGGHRYGLNLGYDSYYWADAVRCNEYGLLEWFCVYPNHSRYGRMTERGIILDYKPVMTLEEFRKLPGQLE